MAKLKIDDLEVELGDLSPEAMKQLQSIEFVNEQILLRNNELQIAETAKIGYSRALKRELEKAEGNVKN